MNWRWYFTSFEGRISRQPFARALIVAMIAYVLAGQADAAQFPDFEPFGPVRLVLMLVLAYPGAAIAAKRWHDRDKSGWWSLIIFVPLIGWLWFLVDACLIAGTPGENRFGPDPLAGRDDPFRD